MQPRRSVCPVSVPVVLAVIVGGIVASGCAGTKFETDDKNAAAMGSTTVQSSSESPSEAPTPGASPNVPPVQPAQSVQPTTPPQPPGPTTDEATSDAQEASETSDAEPTSAPSDTSAEAVTTTETNAPEPSSTSDDATAPSAGGEVPDSEHCAAVADWDPAWVMWEQEVLTLVNEYRAVGANCDTEGEFGPAEPLTMDSMLVCSSRLHSMDMFERDFFDHTNPDGLDPFDRMAEAGFEGSYMGENIAYGQPSPEQVMTDWMESDGHCSNIMNPNFTLIGVGYHAGAENPRDGKHFWTQNFGTPLMQGGGFGGRFGGAATN